jgi:cysteine desulfuration protein SufE
LERPGPAGPLAAAPTGLNSSSFELTLRRRNAATYIFGMKIDQILEDFELLDSWDDRYRYVIELGKSLPPFPEAARTDRNKVQGCASQVWFVSAQRPSANGAGPTLEFQGDSDAHIVKGLIAILFALYSGKPARTILETDALKVFDKLGLKEHLTPQRSNGFRSMVERIRADARAAVAPAA